MLIADIIILFLVVIMMIVVTRAMITPSIRKLSVYLKLNSDVTGRILGYVSSMPELINVCIAASVGIFSDSIYNVFTSSSIKVLAVIIIVILMKKQKSMMRKKFVADYLLVLLTLILPLFLINMNIAEELISLSILLNVFFLFMLFNKEDKYFDVEDDELYSVERLIRNEERKLHLKTRKLGKERKMNMDKSILVIIISLLLLVMMGIIVFNILTRFATNYEINAVYIGIIMGIIVSVPEITIFISSFVRHKRVKNYKNDKGAIEVVNNLVISNVLNLCIIHAVAIILSYIII